MKYTFSFLIRPELAILSEQPPAVRSKIISEARVRAWRDWRNWLVLAVLLLPGVIFVPSLLGRAAARGQMPMWMHGLIPSIASFGCLPFAWLWMKWKLFPKHLRRRMVEHGLAICITCGYDLRGSKDRCPECNTSFERSRC